MKLACKCSGASSIRVCIDGMSQKNGDETLAVSLFSHHPIIHSVQM
jgi:hypothetical protein